MEPTGAPLDLELKFATEADLDPVGYRVHQRMTQHELRIIGFVVEGLRNREIAAHLGTNEDAVKYALRKIFDKTGVFGRLELALYVLYHHALRKATSEVPPLPDRLEPAKDQRAAE
jgi:DNA-binding CsgD family transcriptional regulator